MRGLYQTQETRDESPVHEPAHGALSGGAQIKNGWFSHSSPKSDSFNHFELNADDECKINGLFIEIINDYLCLFMSHTKHRSNFLMLQICPTFGNKPF